MKQVIESSIRSTTDQNAGSGIIRYDLESKNMEERRKIKLCMCVWVCVREDDEKVEGGRGRKRRRKEEKEKERGGGRRRKKKLKKEES